MESIIRILSSVSMVALIPILSAIGINFSKLDNSYVMNSNISKVSSTTNALENVSKNTNNIIDINDSNINLYKQNLKNYGLKIKEQISEVINLNKSPSEIFDQYQKLSSNDKEYVNGLSSFLLTDNNTNGNESFYILSIIQYFFIYIYLIMMSMPLQVS